MLRTIEGIVLQSLEIIFLRSLGVDALLLEVALYALQNFLVALHICDIILDNLHSTLHILGKTVDYEIGAIATYRDVERASQVVQLTLNLLGRFIGCAEQLEVVGCQCHRFYAQSTKIVAIDEREEFVCLVALVEHLNAVVEQRMAEVTLIIDKLRCDRLNLHLLHCCEVVALCITISRDRGDCRFINLLLRLIFALTLIDNAVAILRQILVSPLYNIILGNLLCTVELGGNALPLQAVDKCSLHLVGTSKVALQLCHLATAVVCNNRFQEVGVELAIAHLLNLSQK